MTKPTARQKILTYLRDHPGVSAAEMSRALRVTAANIRHHLAHLVLDGRVQTLGTRPGNSRGRPVQLFGLSDAVIGDNLAGLLDVLLAEALENTPAPERDRFLQALAARLAAAQPLEATGHITRRLALTIERLNRLGYVSRWEAHAAGPRVIFEHCPYAAVIDRHSEVCQLDILFLSNLLNAEAALVSRQELNARGLPYCLFVVGGRAVKPA